MTTHRQEALDYHSSGRPGKIAVVPTKPALTQRDLSLAYSPGVAEPCREIARDPEQAFRYTARGNLVAVVSNGTAVLGLGDLGPLASKPVMEGKGVLFKRFADIDVFDLEVASSDPDDVIRFCELLEPTVGGINLEDISAPACFYIEEELKRRLDIPVFHDDQHGTAVISGAALLNALEIVGKDLAEVRVVFSGAGASAIATAEHYVLLGVRRENILMCDSKGVISTGRDLGNDPFKARFARDTPLRTLAEAMRGADVFVGLSVAGLVTREMVAGMAERPIVFALANPDPEILPEDALDARPDALMATGRSDYPNQINNVLGFPFIFRGALDVRARAINDEMKMAATRALAELAKQDVPESVERAYGDERFRFGADYLIPKPFDPRIMLWVAPAVARAAVESGVARLEPGPDYREVLEARLGRGREVMRGLMNRARRDPGRIVYPEGEHERVIRAAAQVVEEGTARPVLLGRRGHVEQTADALGVSLKGLEILDPWREEERRERYAEAFYRLRQRKGVTRAEARDRMRQPVYFGCMMVREGDADGLVAGADMYYPETIRPALETVGTAEGGRGRVAGLYMMVFENELVFFADTTVHIEPDAEELAEIASLAAGFVRRLAIVPRVAMLSFSNFGSSRNPASEKVRRAAELVKGRHPELMVDGEMQADTAVAAALRSKAYPFSTLQGPANVLVFPNLDAANIAYKLLARLGGAEAIGPILLGMSRPVHVLQRGSEAADIANLTAIAVVDAQERELQRAASGAP
jgi:malate dehydrogenase (oxaloacetate-decarboxylating)(NADP+)